MHDADGIDTEGKTDSVHWCSGYCTLLCRSRGTGSTPVCTAADRARGRAAQAAACKAAEAGSTPAGHSETIPWRTSRSGRHALNVEIEGSNPFQGTFASMVKGTSSGSAKAVFLVRFQVEALWLNVPALLDGSGTALVRRTKWVRVPPLALIYSGVAQR
jgi:hypothetical protein